MNLVAVDLGCVDFNYVYINARSILFRQMGIWQNRPGSCNFETKVIATMSTFHDHRAHPILVRRAATAAVELRSVEPVERHGMSLTSVLWI